MESPLLRMEEDQTMKNKLPILICALALLCLPGLLPAAPLYVNGALNGSIDAWTINFGYSVTNSFDISGASTATGVDFGAWYVPGDSFVTVDWMIGTTAYGSEIGSGTAAVSEAFQYTNGFGYDIYVDSFSLPSLGLAPGTYWLTLQNAVMAGGNPVYWDENDGPSSAFENAEGAIGSEYFAINGPASSVPEPASLILIGSGLLFAAVLRRKRA